MFNDLREYIEQVKGLGEYRLIEGADWDVEVGLISELAVNIPEHPLVLYDKIKGYKPGYRIVTNILDSYKRLALTWGLPLDIDKPMDLVRAYRDKLREGIKPIPPEEVATGPIQENVHVGDEVDLFEFPVPKWHELDGGRYIGTGHAVITKDPDTGYINLGTYRTQAHDRNTATFHTTPARHGELIARKYWKKGLACPVAIVCGMDPLIWSASITELPWGMSEYDYAGWIRNEPIKVVRGEITGLPIPATGEIALEGEIISPEIETRMEGTFGEWEGYYGGGMRPDPVIKVQSILHRNDPILNGAPPLVGPFDLQMGMPLTRSAILWDILDRSIQGIKGVWFIPDGRVGAMPVISIQQQYPGHAKQAALLAAGNYVASRLTRFIIIVDDDVDPSNISEVLWAISMRCDPETQIDIISGRQGMRSDPRLPPDKKKRGDQLISTAFIYACKPYSWIDEFPPSVKSSPEVLEKVKEKWGKLLMG